MAADGTSKFILTVEVGEEQREEVEQLLSAAAEKLHAGLTRSDWLPHPEADGYWRKERHRRLRKPGRLA